MRSRLATVVACLLLSGCLQETTPGAVGGVGADTALDGSRDADAAPDAERDAQPDGQRDVAADAAPTCTSPKVVVGLTGVVSAGWMGTVQVDGDRVYARVGGELTAVLTTTGQTEIVPTPSGIVQLLDVQDGAILYVAGDGDGEEELRFRVGDQELPVTAPLSPDSWNTPLSEYGSTHPMVRPNMRAVVSVPAGIYLWNGQSTQLLSDQPSWGSPWLGERLVTWASEGEVSVATAEGQQRVVGQGYAPVLVGGDAPRVVHTVNPGDGVVAVTVEGDEVVEVHPGRCDRLVSDGRHVAFICRSDDTPPVFWGGGQSLHVWDGRERVDIETGAYVDAPQVGGDYVAWTEYPKDLCSGPLEPGAAMVALADGGAAPVVLDDVFAPCMCCGAIWARPRIEMSAHVVAWNYAGNEQEGTVGWARLTTACE